MVQENRPGPDKYFLRVRPWQQDDKNPGGGGYFTTNQITKVTAVTDLGFAQRISLSSFAQQFKGCGLACAGSATSVGPLLRRYCYFN